MSLPPEILDHIFSHLGSDFVTLKACSLSHPFLSQVVDRFLYARITFFDSEDHDNDDDGAYAPRPSEFNQLLSTTPRIGSCVRILKIVIPYNKRFDPKDLAEISFALQYLFSLKKITLSVAGEGQRCMWETLPQTFCQAILKCLSLPSMEELSLAHIVAFPLTMTKTIKRLTLDNCLQVDLDNISHPFYPLESLSIIHCPTPTLCRMASWVEKCQLRSLAFLRPRNQWSPGGSGFDTISQILANCSNSLTTLHVDIGSRFRTYKPHSRIAPRSVININLSALIHLKDLTISAIVETLHSGMYSAIPAITDLLKTTTSVEHLTLDFLFHFSDPVEFSPRLVDWSTLVHLLVKSSASSFRLNIKCHEDEEYAIICPLRRIDGDGGSRYARDYTTK